VNRSYAAYDDYEFIRLIQGRIIIIPQLDQLLILAKTLFGLLIMVQYLVQIQFVFVHYHIPEFEGLYPVR
jgi:hypothetical protein